MNSTNHSFSSTTFPFYTFWRQLDSAYKKSFLIVFFLNILAFGQEIFDFTMVVDDYEQAVWHGGIGWLPQGRWLLNFIYFNLLGGWFSPFLHALLGISISAVTALLICSLWNFKKIHEIVLIATVISTYPLMVDVYTWETNKVALPMANFFAVCAVYFSRRWSATSLAASSIFVLFSLSIYQTSIHFAVAAVIFQCLFFVTTNPLDRQNKKTLLFDIILLRFSVFFVGFLFYLFSLYLIFYFLEIKENSRVQTHILFLDSWDDFWQRLHLQTKQIIALLFREHDLFPQFLKIMTAVLFFSSLYKIISFVFRSRTSLRRKVIESILTTLILVFGLYAYQLAFLFTSEMMLTYRTISAFSVTIGALAAITFQYSFGKKEKIFYQSIVMILIFCFIVQSNIEFTRRNFVNIHDWQLANRVLARIENHPDFEKSLEKKHIALIGLPSFGGDPNLLKQTEWSPYMQPPSSLRNVELGGIITVFLENYVTLGNSIYPGSKNPSIPQSAIIYACSHQAWPHPESVSVLDDGLIVVVFHNDNVKKRCREIDMPI